MGRYYTCSYCGLEGKGCYYCNCHEEKEKEIADKMIGATIVSSKIEFDGYYRYFCQTLTDKESNTFYVNIVLNSDPGSSLSEGQMSVINPLECLKNDDENCSSEFLSNIQL